jgi:hypothetical protein
MNRREISKTTGRKPTDVGYPMAGRLSQFRSLRSLLGVSGVKFRCFHSGEIPPQINGAPGTDIQYGGTAAHI